ncbi:hypothetical protein PENSPDRAFT_575034 [Peniophora sp. CONT]|nr:hypothetical protein PENSPDRAFT_575034 [Peniophora sp. CONT]
MPPEGYSAVDAPWVLHAKSWTFLYNAPSSSTPTSSSEAVLSNPNNKPEILRGLPAGVYYPTEAVHPDVLLDTKDGVPQLANTWLSCVMILHYEGTPVGPYDELILIPAAMKNPHTGETALRCTSMFVSNQGSMYNGRRNWNIPKALARFEFTRLDASRERVRVYHAPGSEFASDTPFFSAVITSSSLPAIPIPRFTFPPLIQPPLALHPGEKNYPWVSVRPKYKGKWGLAWGGADTDEGSAGPTFGDGISFPAMSIFSAGVYFEGELAFGPGQRESGRTEETVKTESDKKNE